MQRSVSEQLAEILKQRPVALLTDIDGTLSPIAPTPAAAFVPDAIKRTLEVLVRHLDVVAAISGRGAEDAARMIGVQGVVVVGNHGLEFWEHGRAEPLPEAVPFRDKLAATLQKARARVNMPGIQWENKGITASVHYRLADDPGVAEQVLHRILEPLVQEHGLQLTPGRMVWELRPPINANKGSAVRRLVDRYGLRSAIFIGDDRTDVDAFRALRGLRPGGVAALNVGVMAPETPASVREEADLLVDGVEGVGRLLAQLVDQVERRG